MKDPITVKQAAELLNMHPSSVRRLCESGRLRGSTKLGSEWLVPRRVVERLAAKPSKRGRPRGSKTRRSANFGFVERFGPTEQSP